MLDRHELPGVAVVFNVRKRLHDLGMTRDERHPPADHIEAFGHRVNFDAHIAGAVHLQEAKGCAQCK